MSNDVSQILDALGDGDAEAAEKLLPLVYEDLRRLAARKLAKESPGQTLQATALVHEAFLRLIGSEDPAQWDHRGHFFVAAAEAMRRILIDRARHKLTEKRGSGVKHVEVQEADLVVSIPSEKLLDLNDALDKLAEKSPEEAKLVKLRYFAGLTLEEAAQALDISRATASRYWAYARAFLFRAVSDE